MQAVCKHYINTQRHTSYDRELSALRTIQAAEGEGRNVWPNLLSWNDEERHLVTQPLAESMGKFKCHVAFTGGIPAAQTPCLAPALKLQPSNLVLLAT